MNTKQDNETSLNDLLACAVEAATRAGTHAHGNFNRRNDLIEASRHDVKLVLDRECQVIAEGVIRAHFPDHAMVGEEDALHTTSRLDASRYEWIIDPIDGTVNFHHGLAQWCCSIAVRRGDTVLAGAVFAPMVDELFTATAETEAACNGAPIRVSQTAALEAAVIMTGADRGLPPAVQPLALMTRIAGCARRPRIMGSAALDLCHVAHGRADGYCEAGIYIWDVAAAGLIVRRAGGLTDVLCRLEQPHRMCYLASNGRIHEALRHEALDVLAPLTTGC